MCDKCWRDAYVLSMTIGGFQVDHYHKLLEERKDNPCTKDEEEDEVKE